MSPTSMNPAAQGQIADDAARERRIEKYIEFIRNEYAKATAGGAKATFENYDKKRIGETVFLCPRADKGEIQEEINEAYRRFAEATRSGAGITEPAQPAAPPKSAKPKKNTGYEDPFK